MNKAAILCVGGDARMTYTAKALAGKNDVYTYAVTDDGESTAVLTSLDEMPKKADMLILGIIRTADLTVCELRNKPINCKDILPHLKPDALILIGNPNEAMKDYFTALGFEVINYLGREELVLKNTVPTAEGALEIALREQPMTVRDQRVLVIGSGRVAKACAALFKAVGAAADITARKPSALTGFQLLGHKTFPLESLNEHIGFYDTIINTVPALILTEELLESCNKKVLIIDLASKPGGVDFDKAKELHLRALLALGLPGKCAPVTAGRIIAETAEDILNERRKTNVT